MNGQEHGNPLNQIYTFLHGLKKIKGAMGVPRSIVVELFWVSSVSMIKSWLEGPLDEKEMTLCKI